MFNSIYFVFLGLAIATGVTTMRNTLPRLTVHKLLATWEEAQQQCHTEGGLLASPINGEILNAMKSFMRHNKTYHIGTRAGYNPGTYLSLEGVPLQNMTEAMDTMVQELDPLDGDCLAMDRETIRLVPCWTRLQYMCRTIERESSTENMDMSKCGPGYQYNSKSHKCYKAHKYLRNWNEARKICNGEGAQLATVENEDDKDIIIGIPKLFLWDSVFVGLQDLTGEGKWKSVDGRHVEDLYNVWAKGVKPANGTKSCGVINSLGLLQLSHCWSIWYFICERTYSLTHS